MAKERKEQANKQKKQTLIGCTSIHSLGQAVNLIGYFSINCFLIFFCLFFFAKLLILSQTESGLLVNSNVRLSTDPQTNQSLGFDWAVY